ncbi:hypothetical protein ONS95_014204 [Cadophora gregata]|uniref:uncharacterized protein n=1 Tax=Cadophora gregata TaxID=51156 RepID=UPI0026DDAFD1|nr:uncharacterized protein ONS95_014204 [Cadophora gregata]KAK0113959.1 hypothetical protein ONS96_014808 [Cadophora gregata f. sp. sojae]KAK0114720.1 hypothetical protein ONS95_014204 [Cadophora gregata]
MPGNIAATYAEPGTPKIAIETLEVPKPGAGQVLVKMTHSGVCHSDLAVCTQAWPILPFPTQKGQVGGHEGVGEVVEHGPGVTEPKIGTRIGIKWLAEVCGSCGMNPRVTTLFTTQNTVSNSKTAIPKWHYLSTSDIKYRVSKPELIPHSLTDACLEGDDNTCTTQKISGYYTPGTFQQYVTTSAHYCTPIPDGVDSAEAAPILCAGLTVYSGLLKANTKPGDWIVISGAGGGLGKQVSVLLCYVTQLQSRLPA